MARKISSSRPEPAQAAAHHPGASRYLTCEEAAAYLGVTTAMLRAATRKRSIGHVRIGRLVRFRQEDLDTFVEVLPPVSLRDRR